MNNKLICECCGTFAPVRRHSAILGSYKKYEAPGLSFWCCERCLREDAVPLQDAVRRYVMYQSNLMLSYDTLESYTLENHLHTHTTKYFRDKKIAILYRTNNNDIYRKYPKFIDWVGKKDSDVLKKYVKSAITYWEVISD